MSHGSLDQGGPLIIKTSQHTHSRFDDQLKGRRRGWRLATIESAEQSSMEITGIEECRRAAHLAARTGQRHRHQRWKDFAVQMLDLRIGARKQDDASPILSTSTQPLQIGLLQILDVGKNHHVGVMPVIVGCFAEAERTQLQRTIALSRSRQRSTGVVGGRRGLTEQQDSHAVGGIDDKVKTIVCGYGIGVDLGEGTQSTPTTGCNREGHGDMGHIPVALKRIQVDCTTLHTLATDIQIDSRGCDRMGAMKLDVNG
tara:strand:- start:151 stop:918 length:768 start_codon:yes stop_codon:yes gene_type:complete